jgi:hypothetical protein
MTDSSGFGTFGRAWGRGVNEYGRVAYVTTDGGTTAPPDGNVRKAALLRRTAPTRGACHRRTRHRSYSGGRGRQRGESGFAVSIAWQHSSVGTPVEQRQRIDDGASFPRSANGTA